jgi:MFS family permease
VITRYRALFSIPGFGRLLFGSILGRLPSGMFSLAILLFLRAQTGSFLLAGIAVGGFTLTGALLGPLLGALVDRVGQTRVLLPAAVAQSALLIALVLLARASVPVAGIVALAALAGAALPPIAGCVRALWAEVVHDPVALETAYALDATAQEVIWTLGPLLVGASTTLISPAAGVLLCAAVTLCGTLFFASTRISREWRGSRGERSRGGALASSGLRALLLSVAFAGIVLGAVEVGLPGLAARLHAHWSAGLLLALFSFGSMAGGILYSARAWTGRVARRYELILLAFALAVAPLVFVDTLAAGLLFSVVAGLGIAPMLSCQFSLVGALAPPDTATEAFTWHRGATIAGSAAGSALGGMLIDSVGPWASFALGSAGVLFALFLALLGRRRIEPAVSVEPAVGTEPAVGVESVVRVEPAIGVEPAVDMEPVVRVEPVFAATDTITAEAVRLAGEAVALAARAVALSLQRSQEA